jgi:hypothetical protein
MAAADTIRDRNVSTPAGMVDVNVRESLQHTAVIELSHGSQSWTVALNAGQCDVLDGDAEVPPAWVDEALFQMGLGLNG